MTYNNSRARTNGMKLRSSIDIINDAAKIIMHSHNIRFLHHVKYICIKIRGTASLIRERLKIHSNPRSL